MRTERNFMWSVRGLAIGALIVAGLYVAPSFAQASVLTFVDQGGFVYSPMFDVDSESFLCPGGFNNNSGNKNVSGWTSYHGYNMSGSVVSSGAGGFCSDGSGNLFASIMLDFSSLADGQYSVNFSRTGSSDVFNVNFDLVGHVPSNLDIPVFATHFISLSPANHTLVSSTTPFTWGFTGYISSDDIGTRVSFASTKVNSVFDILCPSYHTVLCPNGGDVDPYSFSYSFVATSSGYFSYSSTTAVAWPEGSYQANATMYKDCVGIFGVNLFCGSSYSGFTNDMATTTNFAVVSPSLIGQQWDNITSEVNSFTNSHSATTTLSSACNPLSWNGTACIVGLVVPSGDQIKDLVQQGDRVFVLGYVTDFFSILSGSTTGAMPIVDAYVPPGIPGTGAHIRIAFDHQLDYIYNATTGPFMNSSSPDSGTFYDITSYWWDRVVYVATAFYIIMRILGLHLIPGFSTTELGSESVTSTGLDKEGNRVTYTHSLVKRRKLK